MRGGRVPLLTEAVTMALGDRLQQLREGAGLSQSELAGRAGVSLRSIQNWEQGHRRPKAEALLALARALGVPVESLISALADESAEAPSKPPAKKPAGPRAADAPAGEQAGPPPGKPAAKG